MRLRVWFDEGSELPRGWGVAAYGEQRRGVLALPVPLNLVYQVGAFCWLWLRLGWARWQVAKLRRENARPRQQHALLTEERARQLFEREKREG
jgi:hypothetical protein